jgi:predicted dehydrogenase
MRVGILSFAHLHAEAYISNLQANPNVEFIGLADDQPARARQYAKMFNTPVFKTHADLLNTQPDAVLVCSENARHRPLVEMAASAGAHVLCEKPLATSVEDAHAIVDVCADAGVKLMTAFPMRFSALLLEIKKMLDADGLGQVYALNTTNQGQCPKPLREWFVDKDLAGGGALTDHIVHLADVMRWYLGSEVVEVYAQSNRILHGDDVDVETGGLVMLTFDNGTFATIDCSWSKPAYYPTWGGLKIDIVGQKGLATVDAFRQIMTVYSHSRQRPNFAYWGSDANQAMIDDFVEAIQDDRAPRVSGEDGLKAVEIVAAAYRSALTGEPVGV